MCSLISKLWSTPPMTTSIYARLQIWTQALIILLLNLVTTHLGHFYKLDWYTFFFLQRTYMELLHLWNNNIKKLPLTLLQTYKVGSLPKILWMHWELFTHNINYNQNLKKFNVHSAIIKTTFYQPKKAKLDEVWVPSLFYAIALNLQRSLFVLTMCKNVQLAMQKPFDVNLITKLWKTFISL